VEGSRISGMLGSILRSNTIHCLQMGEKCLKVDLEMQSLVSRWPSLNSRVFADSVPINLPIV
jgi:hypothetical protein